MRARSTEPVRFTWATALVGLVAACAATPEPVPMVGSRGSIAALAGTWAGTYESTETGRSGTIELILSAGQDTAYGEVSMIPKGWDRPLGPALDREGDVPQAPEALRIQFVRVERAVVSGRLEPYRDPKCGCVLITTFRGELEGNRIVGTYVSRSTRTGARHRGSWEARRREEK